MPTKHLAETIGTVIEFAGILALVIGAIATFLLYFKQAFQRTAPAIAYRDLRRNLGKAILLGLELFVAADIIRSVAIAPSFTTIGVLGLIVVIRSFLSWSLELEVNGHWPWQAAPSPTEKEV